MMRMTAIVIAVLAVTACVEEESVNQARTNTALEAPSSELPEALMIALGQAKNFHHKADVHLSDGQVEPAIAAVREILSVRFPPASPAGEEVRLDASARLAKLLLSTGRIDEALEIVDSGIAQANRESFFLANLHTVRADVLEAEAALASDPALARGLKREAIASLDRSIEINRRLLEAIRARETQP